MSAQMYSLREGARAVGAAEPEVGRVGSLPRDSNQGVHSTIYFYTITLIYKIIRSRIPKIYVDIVVEQFE